MSRFTTLRAGEGEAAYSLCLQAFTIMFAYYMLKVIREPLILAEGSAELKAYTTAIQAVLLMFIVPVFARLYQRSSTRDEKYPMFRNTVLFFLLNLLGFAVVYHLQWRIAIAFYVWLGIFSVIALALFWAFAADLFNLKSGQRIFPLIAAASALGALLGSWAAAPLYLHLGLDGVMVCAAILLAVPWWLSKGTECVVPIESGSHINAPLNCEPYPLLEGFLVVWRSRYLTRMAGFVILLNLINTNGDYIIATFVSAHAHSSAIGDSAAAESYITLFYSRYLFITTILSFLIQLLLVSRIFKRLGIEGALYILPIIMIINYSLIALIPVLMVARGALIMENSLYYSLQNTIRHALFLPLSREEKYVGKHTIDTFLFRVGDVISGGFVYIGSTILGLGVVGFVSINIALAGALLGLSRAIGNDHREAAEKNLKNQPPVLNKPIEDQSITAGQQTLMQLDAATFIDADVGDAMRYRAYGTHSDRLPSWIKFDGLNRRFTFKPPPTEMGNLRIRIVARDFGGLEAETCFMLMWDQ